MMHRVLIIDDEKQQTDNLKRSIENSLDFIFVDTAFDEQEIKRKISDTFFGIAIVDLRMDDFDINGFDIIKDIIEINPFAKIIICSAYINEYSDELNSLIKTGKITAILDKEKFDVFSEKIVNNIRLIIDEIESNPNVTKSTLEFFYSDAKNESNKITKGRKFEYFVVALFAQLGFNNISIRSRDKSQNEVDLIIRNEISDIFFKKFRPYFLVECKNEMQNVDKNQFIQFYTKIQNTNGLCDLGFIITPKGFKRTAYLEAMRTSNNNKKIVFISNKEIEELLRMSHSPLQSLKNIIDDQVKDN